MYLYLFLSYLTKQAKSLLEFSESDNQVTYTDYLKWEGDLHKINSRVSITMVGHHGSTDLQAGPMGSPEYYGKWMGDKKTGSGFILKKFLDALK